MFCACILIPPFSLSVFRPAGAEKALFRALKTKKDTPKYGLIYHASMIGSASVKNKGKMSRSLAAKAALATRVDAFGEDGGDFTLGAEHKARLDARLRLLEEGNVRKLSGSGRVKSQFEKYHVKTTAEVAEYQTAADSTLPGQSGGAAASGKKRKIVEVDAEEVATAKPLIEEIEATADGEKKKKKKKKQQAEEAAAAAEEETEATPVKKPKKKKLKTEAE